jgi:hypothetical protein
VIFIRLDENLSPKIGRAAEAIKIRQDVVFETPHGDGSLGASDVHWFSDFGKRGGVADLRIAFSQDGFTDAERVVAELNKITVFYTPRTRYWRPLRRVGQAAYILRWLLRIIELAETSPPGTQFGLPPTFNTKAVVRTYKPLLGRKSRRGRPLGRRKPAKHLPLLDGH